MYIYIYSYINLPYHVHSKHKPLTAEQSRHYTNRSTRSNNLACFYIDRGSINYISLFTIYAFDAFATRHSNNASMHIISQVKQSSEIALCLSGKSEAMHFCIASETMGHTRLNKYQTSAILCNESMRSLIVYQRCNWNRHNILHETINPWGQTITYFKFP